MTDLISEEYLEQLRRAHDEDLGWGTSCERRLPEVLDLVRELKAGSVLDYGCGKGFLVHALRENGVKAEGYDPAIHSFQDRPVPADLLTAIDVLEHIEPDSLDAVLADIKALAPVSYLVIALFPARKVLPDGRNAHLIVQPPSWWLERLQGVFGHVAVKQLGRSWLTVVARREP